MGIFSQNFIFLLVGNSWRATPTPSSQHLAQRCAPSSRKCWVKAFVLVGLHQVDSVLWEAWTLLSPQLPLSPAFSFFSPPSQLPYKCDRAGEPGMNWGCPYCPPWALLVSTFFCTDSDTTWGRRQTQFLRLSRWVTCEHCTPRLTMSSSFLILGARTHLFNDPATEHGATIHGVSRSQTWQKRLRRHARTHGEVYIIRFIFWKSVWDLQSINHLSQVTWFKEGDSSYQ